MKMFAVILLATVAGAIIGAATMKADLALAHAAPASANVCEAVAAAGNIVVYRCEPDYGLPFYVNSVGFMALED